MTGSGIKRAATFLERAGEERDPKQRILCLYDGFVCLYGPMDACRKAASEAGLDRVLLERVLDSCMYDGEEPEEGQELVLPSEDMVSALQKALGGLVSEGL